MKKLLLIIALLGGGYFIGENIAHAETPAICSPDNPCVFTGRVTATTGGYAIDIKVYLKEIGGNYVYVVDIRNGKQLFMLWTMKMFITNFTSHITVGCMNLRFN